MSGGVWIVAGSGPSARTGMVAAYRRHPDASSITCNAGVNLFDGNQGVPPAPTWVWLRDAVACRHYKTVANYLRTRYGTKQVTRADTAESLARIGMDDADHFAEVNKKVPLGEHTPGCHARMPLSGLECMEFALTQRPSVLVLVGCEGYHTREGRVESYFDGRLGPPNGPTQNWYIGRYMQSAVQRAACRFEFMCRPRYTVPALPNVLVLGELGDGEEPCGRPESQAAAV